LRFSVVPRSVIERSRESHLGRESDRRRLPGFENRPGAHDDRSSARSSRTASRSRAARTSSTDSFATRRSSFRSNVVSSISPATYRRFRSSRAFSARSSAEGSGGAHDVGEAEPVDRRVLAFDALGRRPEPFASRDRQPTQQLPAEAEPRDDGDDEQQRDDGKVRDGKPGENADDSRPAAECGVDDETGVTEHDGEQGAGDEQQSQPDHECVVPKPAHFVGGRSARHLYLTLATTIGSDGPRRYGPA
jgi:hypothetical protein